MGDKILYLDRKKQLTPRMKEYLDLKVRGYRQKEIAEMWGVSVYDVEKISHLAKKRLKKLAA